MCEFCDSHNQPFHNPDPVSIWKDQIKLQESKVAAAEQVLEEEKSKLESMRSKYRSKLRKGDLV